MQLQDPEVDRIKSVTVYWDEVVVGMKIEVADREGSFGRTTDADNSLKFNFDESNPLIGIYGYQSPQWIYGIGFYTIDAVSEQCKYVPPEPWVEVELPPEPEPVVEPEPEPEPEVILITEEPVIEEPIEEESKSKVGMIMGIIVAAVFVPVIIYCIVQQCKKCSRQKNKAEKAIIHMADDTSRQSTMRRNQAERTKLNSALDDESKGSV